MTVNLRGGMRFRAMKIAPLILLLAASVLSPGASLSQEPLGVDSKVLMGEPAGTPLTGEELESMTEKVSGIMRCPVCQGLSVADSPTATAVAMKAEVRQFLAQGYSRDQVLRYFEQSYGEFIRLEPKPEGFNLVVWAAPIAGLLLGAALVAYRLRGPKDSAPTASSAGKDDAELAAYREQVRREVSS